MKSSVNFVAPSSETQTWSNATVSGLESGSALLNGSFTYNYNSFSGRKEETYNSLVIEFDKYCDDSYYPRLTGTINVDGTITTQYGWNTTYGGQWKLVGEDLQLSGSLSGMATITMMINGADWIGQPLSNRLRVRGICPTSPS